MTLRQGRKSFRFAGLTLWVALITANLHSLLCHAFAPRTVSATSHPLEAPPDYSHQRSHSERSGTGYLDKSSKQQRVVLYQSRDGRQVDGTGRGLAVFALVLACCIWVFSIPPEFRRAHFCFVERCVQERSKCYDCVTFTEWTDGVSAYYRNGGGVEFDFTVADETKAFWKDAVSN